MGKDREKLIQKRALIFYLQGTAQWEIIFPMSRTKKTLENQIISLAIHCSQRVYNLDLNRIR